MSTVSQAITQGRRRILAHEVEMTGELLRQYGLAWDSIERDLRILEFRIAAAKAAGENVTPSWLRQQAWWRQTQASIETQMQRFTLDAAGTITRTQIGAVRIAQGVGLDYRAAIDLPFAGRVNSNAFERWVSAQQPGSPIRGVIDRYGPRTSQVIRDTLTEGLGSGKGSRAIVRSIVQQVGTDAVEGRLTVLSRTELMRSYRGASRDSFEALGPDVIAGWRWTAALSSRSCVACLSRHGREYAYDRYPDQFHPACRCVISPVAPSSLVPRRQPGRTGEEWLREQPEAVQQRVLRSPERFQAFTDGMSLDTMTTVRRSRMWGSSVAIRPMREVRAA